MAKIQSKQSVKHAIITKNNSTIVISTAVAVFVVMFCIFAMRSLVSQAFFQQRVITEKSKALKVLEENKRAVSELEESYSSFEGEAINVLGGSPDGVGPKDGDNATLVLDALPSEYDYPGLSSSLEKVLVDGGFQIESIGGQEDDSLQEDDSSRSTNSNKDVDPQGIPYPFTITSTPENVQNLLRLLESSIRPFYVETLTIEGQGSNLSATIGLKTFYQPATGLQVGSKVVR